jgi:hypothetical protein
VDIHATCSICPFHLREQSGGNARTAGARICAAYPSDHAFRASSIERRADQETARALQLLHLYNWKKDHAQTDQVDRLIGLNVFAMSGAEGKSTGPVGTESLDGQHDLAGEGCSNHTSDRQQRRTIQECNRFERGQG